jgi:ribosomal protein S18 acetylase RimI-like enzyme
MFIRTASESDLPAIRSLLSETWHDTYDALFGRETVVALIAEWHSVPALRQKLVQPNGEFIVADDGETIAGMGFAAASDDGKVLAIHQLYVRPALQRRGIGGMLLDELLNAFPDVELCRLEVARGNERAVEFYRGFGFEVVGEKDTDPPHLLMERPLGEGAQ